jgi:hypothetical protein
VLRLGIAVSLVTFFAAAKKVTAAPHRGNTNRPTRNQDLTKKKRNRHKPCSKARLCPIPPRR